MSRKKPNTNRDLYFKSYTEKSMHTDLFSCDPISRKIMRKKEKRGLKQELIKQLRNQP